MAFEKPKSFLDRLPDWLNNILKSRNKVTKVITEEDQKERGIWLDGSQKEVMVESRGNQMHVIFYKSNNSIMCEVVTHGKSKKLDGKAYVMRLNRGKTIVLPDGREISNSLEKEEENKGLQNARFLFAGDKKIGFPDIYIKDISKPEKTTSET